MRDLLAGAETIISGGDVPMVLFLELGYSPPTRLNSSDSTIDWNGHLWTGAGSMGGVSSTKDTSGEIAGLKFILSGVPSENIALALGESARGKSCKFWCAILDPDTREVVDAILMFQGELDQLPINLEGTKSTIGVTAVHIGALFRRPRPFAQTASMQQQLYPGDTSRRFLVSQANHQDVWPAASYFRQ